MCMRVSATHYPVMMTYKNTDRQMKKTIFMLMLTLCSTMLWAKGERQTAVFAVPMTCQSCVQHIEKNIAFEPGVKDLRCNLEQKQVTVVFDPTKNSVEGLLEAFRAIKRPATVVEVKSAEDKGKKR